MTHRSAINLAVAVWCWALTAFLASATPVQINPPPLGLGAGFTGMAVQHPMGQSFIANGDSVHTIELRLLNVNMSFDLSQDRDVTLDLFEGIGFDGAHLARQTVDVDQILGQLLGTQASVNFTLGGTPVTSGKAYSFQLSAATARFGSVWFAGNPYAGGQAILLGRPFEDPDLYFAIRAVPEPGRGLLLVAGLLLFLAASVRVRLFSAADARRPQDGTQ